MDRHTPTPQFADAHLITGVRLRYAEQGDPSGQPIILLHGLTDSWFSFSRVLPALAANYHIYALDLRGHGDSDRPAQGYKMSDFAADVVAFMDMLELPSVTLVGHSMGSFIAQQVALAAPRRVARLALLGSATNARTKDLLEFQQAVDTLDDPVPTEFAREFQVSTIYRPVPDNFLNQVVAESLKLPAYVWRAALAGCLAVDSTADLGQIQAPALLLRGDQDTVFSRAAQDSLAAGLERAILRVYPETGHAIHWERPEQVVDDLKEFMTYSNEHTEVAHGHQP
jgi:pimeloyl-ACP methyl ester carboxylesterase